MALLISFVLTALIARAVAQSGEDLLNCGSSLYYPSQACFNHHECLKHGNRSLIA
ncbi:hypothetical protein GYMLUDRAFT_46677, partial [Collybiopsis luxurians FD-317 M1]